MNVIVEKVKGLNVKCDFCEDEGADPSEIVNEGPLGWEPCTSLEMYDGDTTHAKSVLCSFHTVSLAQELLNSLL